MWEKVHVVPGLYFITNAIHLVAYTGIYLAWYGGCLQILALIGPLNRESGQLKKLSTGEKHNTNIYTFWLRSFKTGVKKQFLDEYKAQRTEEKARSFPCGQCLWARHCTATESGMRTGFLLPQFCLFSSQESQMAGAGVVQ